MMITVKFFATLREITGKREVKVEKVNTVAELLDVLYHQYGERFKKELEGRSMILVNGKNILDLKELNTPVNDGDVISIFPPAGGG